MHKRRLLKLAALLDVVPPDKFDMNHWGLAPRAMADEPMCASRACALGWATAIPSFRRAGLELRCARGWEFADVMLYAKGQTPVSNGEAAKRFFGLDLRQVRALFSAGSDDPKEKAAEIRALVAAG